ncbi:hypothetical protein [Methylomagnum sp.]
MPHREEFIATRCLSFGLALDYVDFQFLWLLPVVEVMWADGHCQRQEAETLLHYADRFVDLVGVDVPEITSERVRRFLQPFLDASVGHNPRKRGELTRLANFIVSELVAPAHWDKRSHLYEICVEVAMAARAVDGGRPGRRISAPEERLLKDLLRDLRLDR